MNFGTKHCCICAGVCYHIGPIQDCGNHDGPRPLNRALNSIEYWMGAYEIEHREVLRLRAELAALREPESRTKTPTLYEACVDGTRLIAREDAWQAMEAARREHFRRNVHSKAKAFEQARDIIRDLREPESVVSPDPRRETFCTCGRVSMPGTYHRSFAVTLTDGIHSTAGSCGATPTSLDRDDLKTKAMLLRRVAEYGGFVRPEDGYSPETMAFLYSTRKALNEVAALLDSLAAPASLDDRVKKLEWRQLNEDEWIVAQEHPQWLIRRVSGGKFMVFAYQEGRLKRGEHPTLVRMWAHFDDLDAAKDLAERLQAVLSSPTSVEGA